MSFGTNLEKIRKTHKISQAQLGRELGITQQMISNYEKDLSSPNIECLTKLADYFHVSIDYLLDHLIHSDSDELQKSQFLHLFESFSFDDKDLCLLIMNTLLLERKLLF